MTGAEKAMLLLLSLDEAVARRIVEELSEDDVRKLRDVAVVTRHVPVEALSQTYAEFLSQADAAVAVPRGGVTYLRRLSADVLGETKAREIFDGERADKGPLALLEDSPPDVLGPLLADEPAQLVAAVVARLTPAAGAALLGSMPEERQSAVILHVGKMTALPSQMIDDVASALAAALPKSDSATASAIDGIERAAAILNVVGKAATPLLQALETADNELAAKVRHAMFTFEDLRRVDSRAMREILREVAAERLPPALKGASEQVKAAIFAGLSSRAAELVRDDLELLGKVRRADAEAARREIVESALRLEAEGKVDLGRNDE